MAVAARRFGIASAILLAAAVAVLLWSVPGVQIGTDGRCLLFLPLAHGEPLDLTWRHSVDGILVRDRFTRRGDTLYLIASYMPFFAAGLGEIPGRGRVVGTSDHRLALLDLDEPLADGLPLRVGSSDVAHTLHHRGRRYDLTARVPHQRILIHAARRARIGTWLCSARLAAVEAPAISNRE